MTDNIQKFITSQTCASICCIGLQTKLPYCFSCYYAFNSKEGLLFFKSSATTHHSILISKNPFVSGTILPDKLNSLAVVGIQFEGVMLAVNNPIAAQAFKQYHTKHPLSLAIAGNMWTIQLTHIKMTDSSLGFGKKSIWDKVD
jgi:uncharacterized protein YhbP (UPF0306 family)